MNLWKSDTLDDWSLHMPSVEVVDYQESLGARLVAEIVKLGFATCSSTGVRISPQAAAERYCGEVGILAQDPRDLPERYFFGLRTRPARMRRVALIWTNNSSRNATERNWVVETTGREDLPRVKELIEGLASKFGATASIRLLGDRPAYEKYLEDYSM